MKERVIAFLLQNLALSIWHLVRKKILVVEYKLMGIDTIGSTE
ncbi:MAG TPA: hypothetical protein VJ767_07495 [Nitrososphaeraceae archaeon]|nr:hypothetical protein [Nitrososphaeraceae archaeon]